MAPSTPPADLPPGLALAWGVLPEARRGPKPAHSVERIVAVAVDLADESGFPAVSMPKIANRLGVTANALYRYVASKEELVVLLADAGWGPPEVPARREGWRAGVTGWVRAFVARTRVHPWLLDIPVRGAPLTPNMLSWLEVLLEALADTGLGPADKLACATLLDGYARSTANLARPRHHINLAGGGGGGGGVPRAEAARPRLHIHRRPPRGAAPYAEATFDEDDVELGLQRILDGIEVLIERRTGRHHHEADQPR